MDKKAFNRELRAEQERLLIKQKADRYFKKLTDPAGAAKDTAAEFKSEAGQRVIKFKKKRSFAMPERLVRREFVRLSQEIRGEKLIASLAEMFAVPAAQMKIRCDTLGLKP